MRKLKKTFIGFLAVLMLIGSSLTYATANNNPGGSGWGTSTFVESFAAPTILGSFRWRANVQAQGSQSRRCWVATTTGIRTEIGAQTALMDSWGRDLRSSGIQRRSGTGNFSQFSNSVRSDDSTQIFAFFAGVTQW